MDRKYWRNLVAFWILGLCNNYGYVIMLSAAEDIMDKQKGTNTTTSDKCELNITDRQCSHASTGAVLVADNLPAFIVQATFPFFMHRIPFGIRHSVVLVLQISCYFLVAFSPNVTFSLIGVTLASFSQGIGEITYLALSSFFPPMTIAAWSSGTGGAGLIGSLAYASITEAGFSPKDTLLVMLFIPVLFALTYWVILAIPDNVYTPGFNPKTWLIPVDYLQKVKDARQAAEVGLDNSALEDSSTKEEETYEVISAESSVKEEVYGDVPQRKLSLVEKLQHIVLMGNAVLHLMIPLALVYTAEYLINQGLTELIMFDCHSGFNLPISNQYRWYQVLYQVGVFLSRSSVKVFELPVWIIYLLPVLQVLNLGFFFFEAIYWFVPHIAIIFGLIILEGLLGGAAYVNTYNKIHKMVEPDVREFSMSITTVGNSIGTNIAGFTAIPLHNYVCGLPTH